VRYLLDTHALLWIANDDPRLSQHARAIFDDFQNEMHVSLASLWEIAIKLGLRKLNINGPLPMFIERYVLQNGIAILYIDTRHILPLESLPPHHKDPFDRLIISQAICEDMPVISIDKVFDLYPITRIW